MLLFVAFPLQARILGSSSAWNVLLLATRQQQTISKPPDPEALLLGVRQQQVAQQGALNARLREKSHSIPFQIIWEQDTIRYKFSHPDQVISLRLGEQSAEMWEQTDAASASVISHFDRRIRGTSVTYEDLAFRFLYWPHPTVIGEEKTNTRAAWILQIKSPPVQSSRYGTVRIWVDKESGALLRMEGFDFQGRSLKRFEVISAQKIKGRWLLKEMRIEERDPAASNGGGGNTLSRAYLSILSQQEE